MTMTAGARPRPRGPAPPARSGLLAASLWPESRPRAESARQSVPSAAAGRRAADERGARPGGGDGVAGGASEPGGSQNAMAPIGLKAVVGESKCGRGAAPGPAEPVIQAPPSREGSPSGFLRLAGFPDSRFSRSPLHLRPPHLRRLLGPYSSTSSSSRPSASHLAFTNIPFSFLPSSLHLHHAIPAPSFHPVSSSLPLHPRPHSSVSHPRLYLAPAR